MKILRLNQFQAPPALDEANLYDTPMGSRDLGNPTIQRRRTRSQLVASWLGRCRPGELGTDPLEQDQPSSGSLLRVGQKELIEQRRNVVGAVEIL